MQQQFRVLFKGPQALLDEQLFKRMITPTTKTFFEPTLEISCVWVLAEKDLLHKWFDEDETNLIWYETLEMFNKFKVDNLKSWRL